MSKEREGGALCHSKIIKQNVVYKLSRISMNFQITNFHKLSSFFRTFFSGKNMIVKISQSPSGIIVKRQSHRRPHFPGPSNAMTHPGKLLHSFI